MRLSSCGGVPTGGGGRIISDAEVLKRKRHLVFIVQTGLQVFSIVAVVWRVFPRCFTTQYGLSSSFWWELLALVSKDVEDKRFRVDLARELYLRWGFVFMSYALTISTSMFSGLFISSSSSSAAAAAMPLFVALAFRGVVSPILISEDRAKGDIIFNKKSGVSCRNWG